MKNSFADLLCRKTRINCCGHVSIARWKSFISSIADNVDDQTLMSLMVMAFGDLNCQGPCSLLFKMKEKEKWDELKTFVSKPRVRYFERFLNGYFVDGKIVKPKIVPALLPFKIERRKHFIDMALDKNALLKLLNVPKLDVHDTTFHIGIRNIIVTKNGEVNYAN